MYNKLFLNHNKPLLNIEILISNTRASFTPQNWWHLVFVLQFILFMPRHKSQKQIEEDKKREDELKEIKIDQLSEMIQRHLQTIVRHYDKSNRPIIEKKIVWKINTGFLELIDDNKTFSSVDLKDFSGNFLVFNNKETKCDVDIHKVIIQNHLDHPDYKWALFPGYSEIDPRPLDHMLKVRIRDKLVKVRDASWKVFDQFEIFLNPMTVKFTKKFYTKIQKYMLFKEEQKKIDAQQSMEDDKKIDMLMPYRDHTMMDYSPDELEEVKLRTLNVISEENDSCSNSILGGSSDDENISQSARHTSVIETTTKNYKKMSVKSAVPQEKRSNSFSLNNLSKKITSKFKTMRNVQPGGKDEGGAKHPVFFRYFRINEIGVEVTYKHKESSMLNTKNLRITVKPFIRHSNFMTFPKMLAKYENFCKKSMVYQIPSIIKQKWLKITLAKDDDEDDINDEDRANSKIQKAKHILFGKYADYA